ncbi:aldose 1-epimerase family protein [Streptococcus ratti]|uniref:LacX n=1 Tax=Streptococcus ratti FA-1 = DSM 20564 TaxID=699248 RepID=A0ABN0GV89_STRRT|nr:aldose 1-epimerase family protein [Streptococcus ratti]EJN94174.1 LacX [Streptococcus ratti FA-1 = DSM 20564]EMP69847.1 LacX [Streptococcus ratti FA-1 = DSM 20564]QEY07994.1 aldose 1-epimerase family protein [Streptococcus ratti]VEI60472.1 LacX [Streptococcus mutans]
MTIELKNEKLRVQFKEFGGALSSVKDQNGIEYLWQGNPEYWSSQAPVLFPICGSLRNDWGIYNIKEHPHFYGRIPRHGLVRKKQFAFEQLSENSLAFTIEPDEEMLTQYPYRFELKIIYTLKGSTIRTEYQVSNNEKERTMPYFIGGHPGFNCPLFEGDRYEDYYLEFEKEETCTVPRSFPETGLLDLGDRSPFLEEQKFLDLDYSLFEHNAITLDQLQSRSVTLRSRNQDGGLRLDFADFPYLILWSTVTKSPFIALEPWSGLSTSLDESDYVEEKRGVSLLAPGQTDRKYFDITVL